MKAIGVIKLSCSSHPNDLFVINPKASLPQVSCNVTQIFYLFALLANWSPLAIQWRHTFGKIQLYLPKLVFSLACRLCTWCFAMWVWRCWLIKHSRDFTIKSFLLGSWELTFKLKQTSPIVEKKYLFFYVCCFCCAYWSFKAFFQFTIMCESRQVVVRL